MIWLVCDTPDRIPARIFRALRTDCGCCSFWRGWLLGFVCAGLPALVLHYLKD